MLENLGREGRTPVAPLHHLAPGQDIRRRIHTCEESTTHQNIFGNIIVEGEFGKGRIVGLLHCGAASQFAFPFACEFPYSWEGDALKS